MRLIEAEKAKDVIHEYFKSLMVNGASGTDVDRLAVGIGSCLKHDANLLKAIDELPSVQTDIIFCKDCKHYREYSGVVDGCCNMAEWYRRYQYPEDFCSRAERREDG